MFYFRVVANGHGFEFRRGREVLATFPTYEEAMEHCRSEARRHRPSAVYLHDAEGAVRFVTEFPLDGTA